MEADDRCTGSCMEDAGPPGLKGFLPSSMARTMHRERQRRNLVSTIYRLGLLGMEIAVLKKKYSPKGA